MSLLKILVISIMLIGDLGICLIAWRRVPESQKSQRVPMYIGAVLFFIMATLIFFYGPY